MLARVEFNVAEAGRTDDGTRESMCRSIQPIISETTDPRVRISKCQVLLYRYLVQMQRINLTYVLSDMLYDSRPIVQTDWINMST